MFAMRNSSKNLLVVAVMLMLLLVVDLNACRNGMFSLPSWILNSGAVHLRTYSTFRPGSSIVANTTATCGNSRDYLNFINVSVATPLLSVVYVSKFSVLYVLYCSKVDVSSSLQRWIDLFCFAFQWYREIPFSFFPFRSVKWFERWRTLLVCERTTMILIISLRIAVSLSDVYHGFYSIRSENSARVDFSFD
jgi:hypothetical protein